MQGLFLFSKAGKQILAVSQKECSSNFLVALQTLQSRFGAISNKLGANESFLGVEEGNGAFLVLRDLGSADLFIEISVPRLLLDSYVGVIQEIVFSVLSRRFLDVLSASPAADLYEEMQRHVPVLNNLLGRLWSCPACFVLHRQKLRNWVDISHIFRHQEVAALLFDVSGVIQFYVREGIKLGRFGRNVSGTAVRVNVIYRFCLARMEQICIPEIAPTSVMQISYFDAGDGAVLAIIAGNSDVEPVSDVFWDTLPALDVLDLPKRVHGIAIVHLPSRRAVVQREIDPVRIEHAVMAAEQGSSYCLEQDDKWDTTWINGEYCICIESDRNELVWGEKNQEQILSAAYQYFAFRAWMVEQSD